MAATTEHARKSSLFSKRQAPFASSQQSFDLLSHRSFSFWPLPARKTSTESERNTSISHGQTALFLLHMSAIRHPQRFRRERDFVNCNVHWRKNTIGGHVWTGHKDSFGTSSAISHLLGFRWQERKRCIREKGVDVHFWADCPHHDVHARESIGVLLFRYLRSCASNFLFLPSYESSRYHQVHGRHRRSERLLGFFY